MRLTFTTYKIMIGKQSLFNVMEGQVNNTLPHPLNKDTKPLPGRDDLSPSCCTLSCFQEFIDEEEDAGNTDQNDKSDNATNNFDQTNDLVTHYKKNLN